MKYYRNLRRDTMVRQTATIFFIFGLLKFSLTARVVNRFIPTNTIQDVLLDDARRESLISSLSRDFARSKDDRVAVPTILDTTFVPARDTTFHLFTKENPNDAYIMNINDTENLQASPFDNERSTKIIVHGWTDSVNSFWVKDMRKNYLVAGDYNVFCVDWYSGATKEYLVSARLTRQLGEYMGDFLQYLKSEGNLALRDVHILGHSLGAHIAGFAGAANDGKIGRITGMDPARPGFEAPVFKDQKDHLDPSDATFVDVIHTCAGTAGFVRTIGHADFYPNGGSFRQPGCSVLVSQYCSHGRSHKYMAESILPNATDFFALKCDNWIDYKAGKCNEHATVLMGENISVTTRGKYYLETNSEAPYAKGMTTPPPPEDFNIAEES